MAWAEPKDFIGWGNALKNDGFRYERTRGRKGAIIRRAAGRREQCIEVLEHRLKTDTYTVTLQILADAPFTDEHYQEILLEADLGPDTITEQIVAAYAQSTHWNLLEQLKAWRRLRLEGIGWLEKHSDAQALADFMEGVLSVSPKPTRPKRSIAKKNILQEMTGLIRAQKEIPLGPPPHYYLWLSLLYQELGKSDLALERGVQYYTTQKQNVTTSSSKQRFERLKDYLQQLGWDSH